MIINTDKKEFLFKFFTAGYFQFFNKIENLTKSRDYNMLLSYATLTMPAVFFTPSLDMIFLR